MTNKKTTKRALMMSVVSLFLCFTMLLGTNYAWFTDSVTSSGNKIMAGTLDLQLFMHTETGAVEITDESAPIFGPGSLAQDNAAETLWEPGKTQVVYFSIKNNGTLALKYKVDLIVTEIEKNLNEALVYTITPDAEYGDIDADNWDDAGVKKVVSGINTQTAEDGVKLEPQAEHFFALSVHMLEEAGNEYQNGSITFDMAVLASQFVSEEDSFDAEYDTNAPFPKVGYGDGSNDGRGYVEFALYDRDPDDHNAQKVANVKAPLSALADPEKPMSSTLIASPTVYEGVVVAADQGAQTFDIAVTNIKAGNTVPVSYEIRVGAGLTGVKLYHKGDEVPGAYYNGEYIIFETTSFSPFTVVYDAEVTEDSGDSESTPETTRPKATVEEFTTVPTIEWNKNFGSYYPSNGNDQQLDAVYSFKAPHTTETVGNSAYKDWYCDYFVKFSTETDMEKLPEASITLGGHYGEFGWVGFDNPEVLTNQWIPLLGSVIPGSAWKYEDIVVFVGEFLCGVGVTNGSTTVIPNDAKFIVELRLTNPENENDFFAANTVTYDFATGTSTIE